LNSMGLIMGHTSLSYLHIIDHTPDLVVHLFTS